MKRLIYILSLSLMTLVLMAMGKAPFYIVDGKLGVSPDQLPPEEEIARKIVLKPDEAMYIYGKRASGGAVVINTKEYVETNYLGLPPSASVSNRNESREMDKGFFMLAMAVAFVLPKQILKLISKLTKWYKENHRISEPPYSPGPFDPNGVQFDAKESPFVLYNILACSIVVACLVWFIFRLWTKNDYDVFLLVMCIFVGIFALYFFLRIFSFISREKCHFTIDKEGIHGNFYMDSPTLKIPEFEEVNISWEKVKWAEFYRAFQIWDADELFLFKKKNSDFPLVCIPLGLFPTQKVLDAINYFCAAYYDQQAAMQTAETTSSTGKTKKNIKPEKPLIAPLKLEDNRLIKILMTIGLMILFSPIYM